MRSMFEPNDALQARVEKIGNERAPVLVIDNLAADPELLIDQAEAAFAASARPRDGFPGLTAPAPEGFSRSLTGFLLPTLRKVFHLPTKISSGGCDFQVMSTPFADLTERQKIPHIDVPDLNTMASVHFLCGAPFLGTAFYRHKATGFEIISPDRAALYRGVLAEEIGRSSPSGNVDQDTDCFACVASYPAVFNRAIFFSAASLHAGLADGFAPLDPNPRRGRLTLNLFLQFGA